MESREYQESFEDFLQEKADQYKLYPSDRVWNAINNKLHPRTKWSYLVVAAAFLGLGIGGKMYDSSLVEEPMTYNSADATFLNNSDAAMAKVVPMKGFIPASNSKTENRAEASASDNVFSRSDAADPGYIASSNSQVAASLSMPRNLGRMANTQNGSSFTEAGKLARMANTQNGSSFADANGLQLASTLTPGAESVQHAMIETLPEAPLLSEEITENSVPLTVEETGNEILDHAAIQEALESDANRTNMMATVAASTKKELSVARIPAPEKAGSIKVLKPRTLKIGWQLYASPTVSYRKLSGEGMSYYNNNSLNSVFTADVEKSVRHKPAVGFELGTALTYATGPNFRFKTGVQLNINRYDIEAFSYVPEVAPLTRGGIGHTTINAISRFRNDNGFSKTWLKNQHIMMSLPLGAEITLFGNENVKFNIGGTLQPTFVLNNQAYMISTNMKNYAQEPSLYKRFNVAAGAEAYLSIKSKSVRWMIGPQFRYQIFSSYKKEYPINEHLTDYGFKIGISR